jgi:hypothetical protein
VTEKANPILFKYQKMKILERYYGDHVKIILSVRDRLKVQCKALGPSLIETIQNDWEFIEHWVYIQSLLLYFFCLPFAHSGTG